MHGRRPTISSLHGIVAAAHPLAAQAGARLLASGGNAFDAAAATAAALNVVEPFMSGLAGQGLATCYIAAEKRVRTLDFVPRLPEKFAIERYPDRMANQRGGGAVGTPGNFAGWAELVRAHGRKPLADSLAPAVALARDGFPLIEFNVEKINETKHEIRAHAGLFDLWSATYMNGGETVAMGMVLKQPDLARTLEALAKEGPGLLYGGALGRRIVEHVSGVGGHLTQRDLESVRPAWRDAVAAPYRNMSVHTLPPPCEGFQYLLALRILDGFDLKGLARNGVDHLDMVWRAIRLAAGVRIAHNNPTAEALNKLLSDGNVSGLRDRLRDGRPIAGPTEQWMAPEPAGASDRHTTSFSIADRDGNVICVTQSLGSLFGAGVVVPGTGLCLNNFLHWADYNPKSPNHSRPGGELPICMAPSIATRDGRPCLALGTPGSYGILQTQVQALVQHVDFGLPLQDAIEEPRARLWDGKAVHPEGRLAADTVEALRKRGHDITIDAPWTMRVGGMQGIAIDPQTGAMTGACDPRRDGYVATP
ncbi:MAG: gamma-glutamyltranspeptidase [Alphaproteobacteria bacterium]|nr:gamma-glutamyltranspeptidase [Alphaproteobacteria bacterium]